MIKHRIILLSDITLNIGTNKAEFICHEYTEDEPPKDGMTTYQTANRKQYSAEELYNQNFAIIYNCINFFPDVFSEHKLIGSNQKLPTELVNICTRLKKEGAPILTYKNFSFHL